MHVLLKSEKSAKYVFSNTAHDVTLCYKLIVFDTRAIPPTSQRRMEKKTIINTGT